MWLPVFLLIFALGSFGQTPTPEYAALDAAYKARRDQDYDAAVAGFERAISIAPRRADIRKDLAYTLLKIGEREAARDQFKEGMRLDPNDTHLAMEYAFLCNETKQSAEARRVFDRIRKSGNETAEQAFQSIDRPLREGIERWRRAVELSANNFSGHEELARLAENRDDFTLASEHYQKAWELRPELRSFLLDLGRVWKAMGRAEDAHAALLAASRGAEPRSAEKARELLPERYPYVYEFQRAISIDSNNVPLRRELAYLHLAMGEKAGAENEFRRIVELAPDDLLSAAQLGFLMLNRNELEAAMPLLKRALRSEDDELTDRIRTALRLPQVLKKRPEVARSKVSDQAKTLAQKSLDAGYLKDALKYLKIAHENDPVDFSVILKLGWAHNVMHDDKEAVKWFRLARSSPDHSIAAEADRAYKNLRPSLARFRTTTWLFPFYSSRWHDTFTYGQVKTDMKLGTLPFRAYLSLRFVGDTRGSAMLGQMPQPAYLSESSFIAGAGIATNVWKGLMAWGEAGSAISYLRQPEGGRIRPDYRGGVSYSKSFGHNLSPEAKGFFFETNADAVFVSRFDNDLLFYGQNRAGYTVGQMQFLWNANLTTDAKRQYWANTLEQGPGLRFKINGLPSGMLFSINALSGRYTVREGSPYGPTFKDFRAGIWYAFSR